MLELVRAQKKAIIKENTVINGGDILIPQLSSFEIGLEHWKNYYDMNTAELNLIVKLFKEKVSNPQQDIRLADDVEILSKYGLEGFKEAKKLLESMVFMWISMQ